MATTAGLPAAGRAPRRRLSAEDRRRQIIAATVSVLSRCGYQDTSLAAIASEAGVAKGLLWHYFADGDDLMEQTARVTLVDLRETVARDIDLSAEIPRVIRAAIRRAAALRESHRTELRAVREIVQNLRHPDGTLRFGLNDLYEETYTLQAALFQRGQDEGSLRRGVDTRYLAVTYQGAVDTMLAYLDSYPDTDAETYAAAVADILLTGITSHPAADGGQRS
jgi:AcrR family transcriptional regulator